MEQIFWAAALCLGAFTLSVLLTLRMIEAEQKKRGPNGRGRRPR